MITRKLQYALAQRVLAPWLHRLEEWRRFFKSPRKHFAPFGSPLKANQKLKELLTTHYLTGHYADGAIPVAWVTSGFPVEALRAADFFIVYPENHGALCGARHAALPLLTTAEQAGFSRDLCSYARTDIGNVISEQTPIGRLPKPDILCCCTNICQTVLYWYRELSQRLNVPLFLIDTPYIYGEPNVDHEQYVQEQLEELCRLISTINRKKFDPDRLVEVLKLASLGSQLWGQCLAMGQHQPSPWTGFDGFFHMAPIVAMRGTKECIQYYELLLNELQERVKQGLGGIEHEKFRLLWDNLPIWFAVKPISTTLAKAGFNFVVTTYTHAWAEQATLLHEGDPLAASARAYSRIILNRDLPNRLRIIQELSHDYKVDGAVLHSDRSCKTYSIGQLDLRERLTQQHKLRVLVLEADHSDPRAASIEQIDLRIQAFIETFG